MRTLGIIGQGNFGKFILQEMDGLFRIETYDVADSDAQFQRVAECDYIALAIPLSAYDPVLSKLGALIKPSTIVIDVCSVKLKPLELTNKYLPHIDVLSIHPLFGPATAQNGIEGQKVVIIRDTGSFQLHAEAQAFLEKLRLTVIQMDADKHDRAMAEIQAITYFVAESLADFGVAEHPIAIPSYEHLISLVRLMDSHTPALLDTVESGNPYAGEMRVALMQSFARVNAKYEDQA